MQGGHSVVPALFINSSGVKELWCLSCMLSRPDQANGSAF